MPYGGPIGPSWREKPPVQVGKPYRDRKKARRRKSGR